MFKVFEQPKMDQNGTKQKTSPGPGRTLPQLGAVVGAAAIGTLSGPGGHENGGKHGTNRFFFSQVCEYKLFLHPWHVWILRICQKT